MPRKYSVYNLKNSNKFLKKMKMSHILFKEETPQDYTSEIRKKQNSLAFSHLSEVI